MSILFVCHETGRTNSLIAIAREMLGNTAEEIIFLLVGKAAINLFNNVIAENDPIKKTTIIPLTQFFNSEEIDIIEKQPLSIAQRETIQNFLASNNVNKILIGAPSWHQALAPFQIAEDLVATDSNKRFNPENAFILDGDYYIETGCAFWEVLQKPDTEQNAWRKQFTWLASLENSKNEIARVNQQVKVTVIGDPSIDRALAGKSLNINDAQKIRRSLANDNESIVLVSGTKNIGDDEELLTLLLTHLANDTVQIRFALHPGVLNSTNHITGLLNVLEQQPRASQVRFVVDNSILSPLAAPLSAHNKIDILPYSREAMTEVVDGVACAIPGTQLTCAGISGQPAYYTKYVSYLPESRRFTGNQVDTFFAKVTAKERLAPMTKSELGLPEEKTAVKVAAMVLR